MAYKNNFERKEDIMDILALKKTANEVRKGIVQQYTAQNQDIRVDLYLQQTS